MCAKQRIIATFRNKSHTVMITSVKVKFRASRVSGKAGTIYYQLTHLRRTRCITTGIRLMPGEWDASAQRAVSPEPGRVPVWQCRIECDVDRLHRIIRDLGREGRPYTVDEVADRFCAQSCGVGVTAFMREQIAQLTADNRLGTARNYTRTLRSFSGFLGELPFAAFTERLVEEYNAYLLRRGVVRNTVSFYMRILRSVYNKAVRRRLAEPASPFGGVYTGVDRTRKRAIDERLIARLKSLDLPVSGALPLARDLFVFSYCMRGMAFVDMAFLRKKDMRDGAIHYVRRKTGQRMTVHLEPCMREIIGRYAPRTRDTPYLFPVLTAEDPARAYAQYQVALNYYNRLLKKLASLLGLDSGLSSYTSRHSWATAARNHNVPLPVISAGMGHTSERTTQIYLSALETSVIDSANRKILASLNRCVSC